MTQFSSKWFLVFYAAVLFAEHGITTRFSISGSLFLDSPADIFRICAIQLSKRPTSHGISQTSFALFSHQWLRPTKILQ